MGGQDGRRRPGADVILWAVILAAAAFLAGWSLGAKLNGAIVRRLVEKIKELESDNEALTRAYGRQLSAHVGGPR